MIHRTDEKGSGWLLRWTPLFILCVACVTAYCLMLGGFRDAIEAEASLNRGGLSTDGGPRLLLVMVSVALGWFSISLTERASGRAGAVLLWIAVPACWATIAAGFGMTWIVWHRFPDEVEILLILCRAFAMGAIAVGNYWTDLF